MSKDEVMQLIDEYAQEVKDFGYIDDSQIYQELKSAVYQLVGDVNSLKSH